MSSLFAAEPAAEKAVKELKSDSRAPYVHRLTLYDVDGRAIDPADPAAPPYSPRMTCGKCHPYGEIGGGWHFSEPQSGVAPGRPGEPWLWVDPQTGTVLPISGRGWPGTFKPADVGLTDWQIVKHFGAHSPGGGFGEPAPEAIKSAPESKRWRVSGALGIDCMYCHAVDQQHDPAEAATQIDAENFRWAPTAALGLAVVRGEARKAPDDWDPEMPPDPDHPGQSGPRLVYDRSRFDPDNRVLFNITRRISPERCYFCHSFREVGPDASDDLVESRDVHLAAGLLCVDCHTNEMDHRIVRGYDQEAAERGDPTLAALSCEGCHLGATASSDETVVLGGRYRAPHPQHRGLPPVHFEKLTCTACHSGPWPTWNAHQFQTARAHGLGLATRDRGDDDPPTINGPIFVAGADGKIAPQRMVQPAFWARRNGDDIKPISPEVVRKAAANVLPKTNAKAESQPAPLSSEQIGKVLELLAAQPGASEPVYVTNGTVTARTADGKLDVQVVPKFGVHWWPLAHDVRPAGQSLGVRGCTDCHADDGPMYFGVAAARDKSLDSVTGPRMIELRGDNAELAHAWSLGFKFRPQFKIVGFVCAAVIALVLLRHVTAGTLGVGDLRRGFTWYEHAFHVLLLLGILIQAVTGFVGKYVFGEPSEWLLLVHMVGAPLFILGLTGTSLQWAPRCRFAAGASGLVSVQKCLFWIALIVGFFTMLTMLAAMLPVFGYAEQEALTELHGDAGLIFVIALALLVVVSLAARRRPREVVPS